MVSAQHGMVVVSRHWRVMVYGSQETFSRVVPCAAMLLLTDNVSVIHCTVVTWWMGSGLMLSLENTPRRPWDVDQASKLGFEHNCGFKRHAQSGLANTAEHGWYRVANAMLSIASHLPTPVTL